MSEKFKSIFDDIVGVKGIPYAGQTEESVFNTEYVNDRNHPGTLGDWRDRELPKTAELQHPAYVFDESKYIEEVHRYIDGTYGKHYALGERQATEEIIDDGYGTGFNMGNIHKYYKRYGKKAGYNREDLLKIIHYTMIQLYVHDKDRLGN